MICFRNCFFLSFEKILTVEDYWRWLEESFVYKIRVGKWYNGQDVEGVNGFLDDRANRLIGWATIRQLRVKSGSYFLFRINSN